MQSGSTAPEQDLNLGFIAMMALVMALVAGVATVMVHRRLRSRAKRGAESLESWSPRPLLVRIYHDRPTAGIFVSIVGGWFFFAFLMQPVGMLVFLAPPDLLERVSLPNPEWILLGIAVLFVGGAVVVAFLPLARHWWRLRALEWNAFRLSGFSLPRPIPMALLVGVLGYLVNMVILGALGRRLFPSLFP
jgi:hypothetical protein